MIVNGDGNRLFGVILTDHILIKIFFDLFRARGIFQRRHHLVIVLPGIVKSLVKVRRISQIGIADFYAFAANVDSFRTGNQSDPVFSASATE